MNFDEININELKQFLIDGLSYMEISKIMGCSNKKIEYHVKKNNLIGYSKYQKPVYSDVSYFNKINTKEKAYILGFIIGDGHLSLNGKFELTVCLSDSEVLKFIQSEINCNITESHTLNRKKGIFPNSRINIGNKQIVSDINRLFAGRLKTERRIPIIPNHLEQYLIRGFFDAEGTVTFGHRKLNGRFWQKISFTSQFKMLEGIQKILIKNGISSAIKPKTNENCYVMDFSSGDSVLKFISFAYQDDLFIGLKRKVKKILELKALLRPESDEFGENMGNTI